MKVIHVSDPEESKKVRQEVKKSLFTWAYTLSGNRFSAFVALQKLKKKYKAVRGDKFLNKIVKVDNRYFWRLGGPGHPSKALERVHQSEMNRIIGKQPRIGLGTLLFAITKKCTYQCEHCFEWENLNKKEVLSFDMIHTIVKKFQDFGTSQIMLSGGEPLQRIDDIYKLLSASKEGTDFWIITSGFGLTQEKARKLKEHGLTGLLISLDHFDEKENNKFRGNSSAFENATNAVKMANDVGLVTSLSLCLTNTFVSKQNIQNYLELANNLNVAFVQLLEPRAKGRYAQKNVTLTTSNIDIVEELYAEYNNAPKYKDYPIINYLGYHQRRLGCFGGGNRFLYIDTDGDAHLCPYCDNKVINAVDNSAEEIINCLEKKSCYSFTKNDSL